MARGEVVERQLRAAKAFEPLKRLAEPRHEIGGGGEFGIGQCATRLGWMQTILGLAQCFERVGQAARSSTWTRPAQNRALERGDGVLRAVPVEPQQRMF